MSYLPSSTLSILSTLNNSREIQQLPIKINKKLGERERPSQEVTLTIMKRRKKIQEYFRHQRHVAVSNKYYMINYKNHHHQWGHHKWCANHGYKWRWNFLKEGIPIIEHLLLSLPHQNHLQGNKCNIQLVDDENQWPVLFVFGFLRL